MKLATRVLVLGGILLSLSQQTASAQSAVISLEIYSVNFVPVPGGPVTTINAMPGDIIELFFRVSGWGSVPGNNLVKGFQTAILYSNYVSGAAGNVLPLEFNNTTDPGGVCPNTPSPLSDNFFGSYIEPTTPGWIFSGISGVFTATDTHTCNYRWAGATLMPGAADNGQRRYVATLVVQVSADAAGTFTLNPNPDQVDGSFLRNQNSEPILPLAFEGCTIVTPGGAIPSIMSSVPANGSIDARQPHPISNMVPAQGWNQATLNFSASASGLTPASFEVSVVPAGGPIPSIMSVVPNGNSASITFTTPIPPGKWTRIRHVASNSSTCLGFLPGDVNNDRTASPIDILKLIDHLNGVEMYQPHQTDVDRSMASNPADILRVIDLLNGADAFDVWNGVSLPPNPCN